MTRSNRREASSSLDILGMAMFMVFLLVAVAYPQEASEPLRPHGFASQASRSVPYVRRVDVDDSGAVWTAPTTWTAGSKVVELCNWSGAQLLYLENVENNLTNFMAIDTTSLSVLPSKGCRSLGAQVVTIGYRVETGEAALSQTFADVTGGPFEIKAWK